MTYEAKKLMEAYDKYGKIIIGVDFDDTFWTTKGELQERCSNVRDLLMLVKNYADICLWTVADKQSLPYKAEIMKLHCIEPAYVNKSPVEYGDSRKPYFNLLLDDNAGLRGAMAILQEFINRLEERAKFE